MDEGGIRSRRVHAGAFQVNRGLLPQAPERCMGERLPGGCIPSENFSADTDGGSRQGAALARALRATLAALLPFIYENIWKNVDKYIL